MNKQDIIRVAIGQGAAVVEKYIGDQIELSEVITDLVMLDDKDSKYYDKTGNKYFGHETLGERVENYALERLAKVVTAPIVVFNKLFGK